MEQFKSLNSKMVLKIGLLAGGILLYAGVIEMIAAFHEREVIDDFITLGQLVLLMTPFLAAFYTAHKLNSDGENIAFVMGSGIIIGILTAIPTIILLVFNDINDVSNIFVNVNRDWIDVVTFDNRKELLTGIFTLALASTVSGLVGSVFYVLPDKPRRALIYGLSVTLIVSVFGETVRLVLKENMDKDTLNELFRRDTLKQQPALILFVMSTTIGYLWAMFGQQAKVRYQAIEGKQRSTTQMIGYVILIGILLILPWVIGRTLSDVAVTIGLFVLMGLGLNIAIGLAGLLDLGYVTNYAVGAYILAVFTSIGPLGLGNGEIGRAHV